MEEALFGDVLRELLGDRRVIDLAEALNVHRSVIYNWLANQKTPALNSTHVAKITAYLRLGEKKAAALNAAQIRSLRQTVESPRQRKRRPRHEPELVGKFIAESIMPVTEPLAPHAAAREPARAAQPATVRGAEMAMRLVADLLATCRPSPHQPESTILVSMQGKDLLVDRHDIKGERHAWLGAMREALRHGWKVEQLWRLDKNLERSLHIVGSLLELVGLGDYSARYFAGYALLEPAYDVVIIPGHAAIVLLAADNATHADAALVLTEPEQIALTAAHYRQLRHKTDPLAIAFNPKAQEMEVTRAMVKAEGEKGGRVLIKDGLGALTMPPAWLTEDSLLAHLALELNMVQPADLPDYLRNLRQRFKQFERLVEHYDYLDICPQRAVRELAANGTYHPDMPFHGRPMPLPLRLEHIEHVIHLLRTHARYHLALPDEYEETAMHPQVLRCVSGGSDAFTTTVQNTGGRQSVSLQVHITQPMIVQALREQLLALWEGIAPPHKHKPDVIAILTREADELRRRIREGGAV